jgi:hypothetical protein
MWLGLSHLLGIATSRQGQWSREARAGHPFTGSCVMAVTLCPQVSAAGTFVADRKVGGATLRLPRDQRSDSVLEMGDPLPPISLRTADGASVQLQDFFGRRLLVQCLRYYG